MTAEVSTDILNWYKRKHLEAIWLKEILIIIMMMMIMMIINNNNKLC